MYAGARLTKLPQNEEDWSTINFDRKLSQDQLEQACNLGVNKGQAIKDGSLKPTTVGTLLGPLTGTMIKAYNFLAPFYYKTVEYMGAVSHQRRNPGPLKSTEVFCFTTQIIYKRIYFNNIEYGKLS
jgi:hypothetical protein